MLEAHIHADQGSAIMRLLPRSDRVSGYMEIPMGSCRKLFAKERTAELTDVSIVRSCSHGFPALGWFVFVCS